MKTTWIKEDDTVQVQYLTDIEQAYFQFLCQIMLNYILYHNNMNQVGSDI